MHPELLEGFHILSVSSFELLSYWGAREKGRGQLERAALHRDRLPTGLNDLHNVAGDAARDEIIEPPTRRKSQLTISMLAGST